MGSSKRWRLVGSASLAAGVLLTLGACSSSGPAASGSGARSKPATSAAGTTRPGSNPSIITTEAPVTKPLTTVEKCEAEVQSVKTAALAFNVADEHVSTWPKSGDDLLFDPREKPLRGREWMPALPTYVLLSGDGSAPPTLSWKPDAPPECTAADIDLSLEL
jgi:hypothetical protein